jgi:CheY-like chemotaxis protein
LRSRFYSLLSPLGVFWAIINEPPAGAIKKNNPEMKSPLHILHLEDDVMDAELVQETLLADGIECEITRVETEADFLAALEQGGFDLVFADYSLPSFDGFSALKVVQRKCPDLPVIFVSGTMVEELPVEALKLGGTDYVLKARLLRIVPSVKRAVREAEERAELAMA